MSVHIFYTLFLRSTAGVLTFYCCCFRDTKQHSFQWVWEDGVKLLPNQQCSEDDSKLSKADVMEYLHRIMPNR